MCGAGVLAVGGVGEGNRARRVGGRQAVAGRIVGVGLVGADVAASPGVAGGELIAGVVAVEAVDWTRAVGRLGDLHAVVVGVVGVGRGAERHRGGAGVARGDGALLRYQRCEPVALVVGIHGLELNARCDRRVHRRRLVVVVGVVKGADRPGPIVRYGARSLDGGLRPSCRYRGHDHVRQRRPSRPRP